MASRDWVKLANKEVKIYDYMVSCKDMVLPWSSDLGKIEEFMADKGRDVAATVRDDEVVDVVGKEDVESINEAFVLAAHHLICCSTKYVLWVFLWLHWHMEGSS
ncbi:inosine-5'-monophosphate dehydrogenase 2 isoform X1 [Rosa chinensis]|uniref:inosine-5'-monophosphate dehydrogenase 2 isoform X1 n=1 Tax=Rosa chinensis TaxID=74649 RepID=UPI001AD89FD9|nr:inosine-5'-monophosphate dehydrogenase 2 isoform X1 [Rosa chinensis]